LLLNLAANIVIAGLALHGHLGLAPAVAATLAATALLQSLFPVPILARVLGGPVAERAVVLPHGNRLAVACVVVGMITAAWGLRLRGQQYSGWLDGQGRAFVRAMPRVSATTDFRGVNLDGRKLRGLSLDDADFTDASLESADLSHARLQGSVWTGATLDETKLFGADLRGARFSDVQLNYVDLRSADLRGATFERVSVFGGSLAGALLDDAKVDNAAFSDVEWFDVECPNQRTLMGSSSTNDRKPAGCEFMAVENRPADAKIAGRYCVLQETLDRDRGVRLVLASILGIDPDELPARPYLDIVVEGGSDVPVLRVGQFLLHHGRGPGVFPTLEGGDYTLADNEHVPAPPFSFWIHGPQLRIQVVEPRGAGDFPPVYDLEKVETEECPYW
jgi:hypothetical protein